MLKKSITYTNPFTEQEVTEEHYFHISKADLVEMEMEEHSATYKTKDGAELTGMQAKLQRIIDAEDGKAIMIELKDMIRRSYGLKDGDNFRKSEAIWQNFSSTEAFSQLLFELCTDASMSAEFMNGIVPSNLAQEAASIVSKAQSTDADQGSAAIAAVEQVAEATGADFPKEPGFISPERKAVLDLATPENPIAITQADVAGLGIADVSFGLESGKYQLS